MRDYSISLIALLKGIVYASSKDIWENILTNRNEIKMYFDQIGLELFFDESEGYAFLKQKVFEPEQEIPRVIERRQLSFYPSLLCLLLRKYLLENDAVGTTTRAILTRTQIIDMLRIYLPESSDEAKQIDKVDTHINRVIEYGFLKEIPDSNEEYEISRIIKAFVNADVIDELMNKYQNYSLQTNG